MTTGTRIGWADLPARVRATVEEILGGPVVAAASQSGGFSPGTADRVRTAAGRRAFVKAVSPAQNEDSPAMHRREAGITAALPAPAPAPRLLGVHDDGEWIALVLSDVEGRHPATPWRPDELGRVLDTLDDMARALTPSPVDGVPSAAEYLAEDFAGWSRIAGDPPSDLDSWTVAHLDELVGRSERGLAALAGDTLVHFDVRADNLLVGPDGSVSVVDWPHACRGPTWLDRLLLLVNVRLYGGHDTQAMLRRCAADTSADPDDLVAVLVGVAGYFHHQSRRPPPKGIPTVRAFQRAQGDAVLSWLREAWPS